MNIKLLCLNIPFLLGVFLIGFISYGYYIGYLLSHFLNGYKVKACILGITYMMSAIIALWAQIKCIITDPGYVRNAIIVIFQLYSRKVFEEDQQHSVQVSNRASQQETDQKDQEDFFEYTQMLLYAKEPLLKNQDIENQQEVPPLIVEVKKTRRNDQKKQKHENIFDQEPSRINHFSTYKYCDKCKEVKPPRSHHCSICKECILRMDHHCPWVGNCVALKTHKFFWNFLLYVSIGSLQVAITMLLFNSTYDSYLEAFRSFQKDVTILLTFTLSCSFLIAVGCLFGLHTFLILQNMSTIEMNVLAQNNIYNVGMYQNWIQIFGPNWKTWLIPVDPDPPRTITGIEYPKKQNVNAINV